MVSGIVVVIGIPALMVLLSMTLPARVNRATNLVVALLEIPLSAVNAAGESWAWASFYGLSIGIEVPLLALILRSAWKWPRTPPSQPVPRRPTFDSRYPCKSNGVKPAAAELIGSLAFARFHYRGRPVLQPNETSSSAAGRAPRGRNSG